MNPVSLWSSVHQQHQRFLDHFHNVGDRLVDQTLTEPWWALSCSGGPTPASSPTKPASSTSTTTTTTTTTTTITKSKAPLSQHHHQQQQQQRPRSILVRKTSPSKTDEDYSLPTKPRQSPARVFAQQLVTRLDSWLTPVPDSRNHSHRRRPRQS